MKRKNEKRKTKPTGFTLIELLVVITIIAILGAVVAPRLLQNPEKARVAAATADVRSIQLQADSYQLDKGKPITSLQELVTAGYLEDMPVDPWGTDYSVEQRDGDVKIRCAALEAKKATSVSKIDIDLSK